MRHMVMLAVMVVAFLSHAMEQEAYGLILQRDNEIVRLENELRDSLYFYTQNVRDPSKREFATDMIRETYRSRIAFVKCRYKCLIDKARGKTDPCDCAAPSTDSGYAYVGDVVVGPAGDMYLKNVSLNPPCPIGEESHRLLGAYLGATGGIALAGAIAGVVVSIVSGGKHGWSTGPVIGVVGSGVGVALGAWRIGVGVKVYGYTP
jgi:hypothetical protein